MDPNETLRRIEALLPALDDDDVDEAEGFCADLSEWLDKGGFAPEWTKYPEATKFYKSWVKMPVAGRESVPKNDDLLKRAARFCGQMGGVTEDASGFTVDPFNNLRDPFFCSVCATNPATWAMHRRSTGSVVGFLCDACKAAGGASILLKDVDTINYRNDPLTVERVQLSESVTPAALRSLFSRIIHCLEQSSVLELSGKALHPAVTKPLMDAVAELGHGVPHQAPSVYQNLLAFALPYLETAEMKILPTALDLAAEARGTVSALGDGVGEFLSEDVAGWKWYACDYCNTPKKISTNHTMGCLAHCENCSWKGIDIPGTGNYAPPDPNRPMHYVGEISYDEAGWSKPLGESRLREDRYAITLPTNDGNEPSARHVIGASSGGGDFATPEEAEAMLAKLLTRFSPQDMARIYGNAQPDFQVSPVRPAEGGVYTYQESSRMHESGDDIYSQLQALGVPMESHESDLYVPITPETSAVVRAWKFFSNVTTFRDEVTGVGMYDIPFANSPFYGEAAGRRKSMQPEQKPLTFTETVMEVARGKNISKVLDSYLLGFPVEEDIQEGRFSRRPQPEMPDMPRPVYEIPRPLPAVRGTRKIEAPRRPLVKRQSERQNLSLKYLATDKAWCFCFESTGQLTPTSMGNETLFPNREEAVQAAAGQGLSVTPQGRVTASTPKALGEAENNNNCDGAGPHTAGEVRRMALGESGLILCRACYDRELAYQRSRGWEPSAPWDSAPVYSTEGRRKKTETTTAASTDAGARPAGMGPQKDMDDVLDGEDAESTTPESDEFMKKKSERRVREVTSPDGSVDHDELCATCGDPRWKHKNDGKCQNLVCGCTRFLSKATTEAAPLKAKIAAAIAKADGLVEADDKKEVPAFIKKMKGKDDEEDDDEKDEGLRVREMFKANGYDTAKALAQENDLLFGLCPFDGKYYAGTASQLDAIGVVVIDPNSEAERTAESWVREGDEDDKPAFLKKKKDDDGDEDEDDDEDKGDKKKKEGRRMSVTLPSGRKVVGRFVEEDGGEDDEPEDDGGGEKKDDDDMEEAFTADEQLQVGEMVVYSGGEAGIPPGAKGQIVFRVPGPGGFTYNVDFPDVGPQILPQADLTRIPSSAFPD